MAGCLSAVVILLFVTLSFSSVQGFIAQAITNRLNQKYGINISLEKIKIKIYGSVDVESALIRDHHLDTLVYSKSLTSSIFSFRRILEGKLNFGDTAMEGLIFNLRTYKSETKNNLERFIESFPDGSSDNSSEIFVSNIHLRNGRVVLTNENDSVPKAVNFDKINLDLKGFQKIGESFSLVVGALSMQTAYGQIKDFKGVAGSAEGKWYLKEFKIQTDASEAEGTFFCDKSFDRSSHFELALSQSKINLSDLNPFMDIKLPNKTVYIDASASGTSDEINFRKLSVETSTSFFEGKVSASNYNDYKKMALAAEIQKSNVNLSEVDYFLNLFEMSPLPEMLNIKSIGLQGTLNIKEADVQTDLKIIASAGNIDVKSSIRNIYDAQNMAYQVSAKISNASSPLISKDIQSKRALLEFTGEGKGRTEKAAFALEGHLKNFSYKNQYIRDIPFQAKLLNGILSGDAVSKDERINAELIFSCDLLKETKSLGMQIKLNDILLGRFFEVLQDEHAELKSDINVTFNIISSKKFWGEVDVSDISYKARDTVYTFQDFGIFVDVKERNKFLHIDSENILNLQLQGNIENEEIVPIIKNALAKVYRAEPSFEVPPGRVIIFEADVHSSFFEAFFPDIKISEDTKLKGKITSENQSFNFTFNSSMVDLFGVKIEKPDILFDNNLNNSIKINAAAIKNKLYDISDFRTFNFFKSDTVFFKTTFKGSLQDKDYYDFNYYFTVNRRNRYVLGMKPSTLDFNENKWKINEKDDWRNKVEISQKLDTIFFNELGLKYRYEQASINGYLSHDGGDLRLNMKNINLEHIFPKEKALEIEGLFNAEVYFLRNEKRNKSAMDISIEDLSLNRKALGNMELKVFSLKDTDRYGVAGRLQKDGNLSLIVDGVANYSDGAVGLDLRSLFNEFNLDFAAVSNDIISDIAGRINGQVTINGTLAAPKFNGDVRLDDGTIALPYINVKYFVENHTKISFDSEKVSFSDVPLSEKIYDSKYALRGFINYSDFQNWVYDLKLTSRGGSALFLNTTNEDNNLFYGVFLGTGTARLSGHEDDLELVINVETLAGTKIVIPIEHSVSGIDDSYVKLKPRRSTIFQSKSALKNKSSAKTRQSDYKMEIVVNTDITPDASFETVFKDDSEIKMQFSGRGKMSVKANLDGDFGLYGGFTLEQGQAALNYLGFINKEFKLLPGGSITWQGSAFDGYLKNVEGVYTLKANPDILTGDYRTNRNLLTEVTMVLNGSFSDLKPSFRIDFPSAASYLKSDIEFYLRDPQELQNQALALITSGSFMNKRASVSQLGTSNLNASASQLLSSVFKDKSSKIDLGISYEGSGANDLGNSIYPQNQLGLLVSTNISDRIRLNGNIGIPTSGIQTNSVAGEGELEIILNKEGSLSTKIFNRRSSYQDILNQQDYSRGVGLYYNVDFNNFQELLKKVFSKKAMSYEKQ